MSVGIDIGSKTIKAVELVKEGDKWRLKASGIISYKGTAPEHATEDKELVVLADAIRKLVKEAKISSRDVNFTIPETQVFTRIVKFPLLTDQEIASAVKWEAEQYIPFPINDAIIQHQIIERKETVSPPQAVVLLIAVPKLLVERYVKLVEMSGLNPAVVETDLLAMTRALAPADQTVVLMDFGARSTNIAIAKKSQLSISRSVPTAGEAFTRAIAKGLGVEAQQAEEYKKTYGLSHTQLEGRISGVIDPVFRMVADEVKKAIHFYISEEGGDQPKSVILSGGSAGMPEVVGALTRLLGMEVVIANPFARMIVDAEAAKVLSNYAPLYSIAVGAAMRE